MPRFVRLTNYHLVMSGHVGHQFRHCANPAFATIADVSRRYCSQGCANRMGNHLRGLRGLLAYWQSPKFCSNVDCGIELAWPQRSNRYCSKGCAARDRQRDRPKPVVRRCEACGADTTNERFCGTACAADTRRRNMDHDIEARSGIGFAPGTLRRYLLRRHSACAICEASEWRGHPMPLIMDHIDGNPSNDLLDNLRLICPNCDALLPTYKSRNRGNGRAWRRERYHAGKSY